jgi:outer membrane lipoprotein-sorting protein
MGGLRRLATIATAGLILTAPGGAMGQVPLPQPRPAFGQIDLTQVEALEAVNTRFNQMQTMQGQFFQIGPGPNELSEGEFFFARPGLLRLNYYPPSQLVVISNGNVMSVDDRARGTQNFYRLARTPLAPILAPTTNLTSEDLVRDVILDREEFIILVLATADDGSWLSLYFDRQTYDLRQWVTVDARGNTITFVMYETEINQPVDGEYFRILNFRGSG